MNMIRKYRTQKKSYQGLFVYAYILTSCKKTTKKIIKGKGKLNQMYMVAFLINLNVYLTLLLFLISGLNDILIISSF
jgi:hypothetical protein